MSQFAFFTDGLEVDLLEGFSTEQRRLAAVRAINKIARDARAQAAKMIRNEVNLPARYVSPSEGRLAVTKQANGSNLEARITARGRATSLAQFVTGSAKPNVQGVHIEVAPGKARFLRRAFLIRLPQGNNPVTDTKFNLGLAVRLKPGDTLRNKITARRVEKGLYLLYGPSVSQVFRANDGDGIANEMTPGLEAKLRDEFLRLLRL